MNICRTPEVCFFVAVSILNHPAPPVIQNKLSRQKVGFHFLTNVV
jgi:hypothetical protein